MMKPPSGGFVAPFGKFRRQLGIATRGLAQHRLKVHRPRFLLAEKAWGPRCVACCRALRRGPNCACSRAIQRRRARFASIGPRCSGSCATGSRNVGIDDARTLRPRFARRDSAGDDNRYPVLPGSPRRIAPHSVAGIPAGRLPRVQMQRVAAVQPYGVAGVFLSPGNGGIECCGGSARSPRRPALAG